jgi:hypothetical protein
LSRNETPQGSDAKTRNVSSRLAMTEAAKTKQRSLERGAAGVAAWVRSSERSTMQSTAISLSQFME